MSHKKVWLITGCSTGLGRELAQRLIQEGYPVVVTARNPESLNELAAGREDQVLPLRLDVTDPQQIEDAVAAASEKFGRVDVLVNNAGIGYFASVEESLEDKTRKMFEINFWGLMRMTRAVLPLMRKQQSGHIINFSSIGGLASFPALGYYHATKYAVEGISESLAQEVASSGIKVTVIEPSSFRTDWGGRSSAKTPTTIPAYEETAGQVIAGTEYAGSEPGDPAKAAQALLTVAELEQPPLRLLLGQAAYHVATNKFNTLLKSIEEWKDTTINADFSEQA